MAKKGQILTNPQTGDVFEFLETSGDNNGAKVVIKTTLKAKGQIVPNHIHVFQDESFEVISGSLTVWSEGKTFSLSEGQSINLPKNKPHNHFNSEDQPVTYIHTVSPALDFEYLVENLVGLAADGKSKNGKYGMLQELVTLKYLDSKAYLANIPIGPQKFLMNTIAPLARVFGYRAIYRKYSGIEK
ncbi:MAG: cupin domain-containing protein [Cytophagaceae bacterium]